MFPGMNKRQMEQMMRQMGMVQTEVEASQVIMVTPKGNLIIENPQVTKVNMMGQETYQIVGEAQLQANDVAVEVTSEDINTVVEQTHVSADVAKQAIIDANGDLAAAILNLTK